MSRTATIVMGGRAFAVAFERQIAAGQRHVTGLARDAEGAIVAEARMTTGGARPFLGRDTADQPPTWEELEDIAVGLLRLELEEAEEGGAIH